MDKDDCEIVILTLKETTECVLLVEAQLRYFN